MLVLNAKSSQRSKVGAIGAAKAAVEAAMPFPKGSASGQLQATSPLIMDFQEFFAKYKTNQAAPSLSYYDFSTVCSQIVRP